MDITHHIVNVGISGNQSACFFETGYGLIIFPFQIMHKGNIGHNEPLVLCAMLYDFGDRTNSRLLQLRTLPDTPGSPARVFNIDSSLLRQLIEELHQHGWVRYEGTHNLDQIRLLPGYDSLSFLAAYFNESEPVKAAASASQELFE